MSQFNAGLGDPKSGRRIGTSGGGFDRLAAFAVTGILLAYVAVRGGGYDIVVRQELGLIVWWGLALAFAFGLLPRARPVPEIRTAALFLALLVAWTALSLLWTESAEQTFAELSRLLTIAGVLVLAWTGLNANTNRGAAAAAVTVALAVPVLALVSRLDPSLFPAGTLDSLDGQRLAYPLGYWNGVACWSAMAVALAVTLSSHLRDPALRAACLAATPAAGLALVLSFSRGGMAAAALGLAVGLYLSRNRWTLVAHALALAAATGLAFIAAHGQAEVYDGTGTAGAPFVAFVVLVLSLGMGGVALLTDNVQLDRRHDARWLGPIALGACAVVLLVGWLAVDTVAVEPHGPGPAAAESDPATRFASFGGIRGDLWDSALGAFASSPVEGIGPGSFRYWWARDGASDAQLVDAHSLYLETLAELGLPGLALLGGFMVATGLAAWRARRAARRSTAVGLTAGLTAAFCVFAFQAGIDWMWELTAVALFGVGAASIAASSRAQPRPRPRRLTRARVGLVALAVAAGCIQIPGLVSTERVRALRSEVLAGDFERANEIADDAVAAEPWAASPYAARAVVALASGDTAAAVADAETAAEHEPTNWQMAFLLARAQIAAGETAAAERELDEVLRLRPALEPQVEAIRQGLQSGEIGPARP